MNTQTILRPSLLEYGLLLAACAAAYALMTWNNDFPVYFHADELKKLSFIQLGVQDFKHPILMLQVGRIVTRLAGLSEPESMMVALRSTSAAFGVVTLLVSFFLTRKALGRNMAWVVFVLLAVSPIFVVHGHYYKEDMAFIATAMLSVYFYLAFVSNPGLRSCLVFGVSAGLVLAAQYKAFFLMGLFLLYPLIDWKLDTRNIYRYIFLSLLIGAGVAMAINYPALLDTNQFLTGLEAERKHIAQGHTLKIYPLPEWFTFHLRKSLIPGITLPLVVAGLTGVVLVFARWTKASTEIRFLAIFVVFFYLIHESTPMKPAPGYIRYMIPVVPALMILSGFVLTLAADRFGITGEKSTSASVIAGLLILLCVVYPAYKSVRLVNEFNRNDTRSRAVEWLKEHDNDGAVYYGKYSLRHNKQSGRIYKLDDQAIEKLRQEGYRYAVASSFGYQLYYDGAELPGQWGRVYNYRDTFERIFNSYEYTEILPAYESFAFSNPVIRIIDLDKPVGKK